MFCDHRLSETLQFEVTIVIRAVLCLIMSHSLQPHGLQPVSFLCPWSFTGKNAGVGCHSLLQEIFPTHGWNLCLLHLLHWQANPLPLSHLASPSNKGTSHYCLDRTLITLTQKQSQYPTQGAESQIGDFSDTTSCSYLNCVVSKERRP